MVSSNLYDLFGVLRYEQGSAQTPWRWASRRLGEEGTYRGCRAEYIPTIGISSLAKPSLPPNVIMYHCLRGKISNCKLVKGAEQCPNPSDPASAKKVPNYVDFCEGCTLLKNCKKLKVPRMQFSFGFMVNIPFLGEIGVKCTYQCDFDGEQCECWVGAVSAASAPPFVP